MAYIVKLATNNAIAEEIADAMDKIRDGMSTLKKYEHLRAVAIDNTDGDGLATFESIFGITENGQAFSDRLGAVNVGSGTQAALMEMVNEVVATPDGA